MNDALEKFRNDAYSLYFEVLGRYKLCVRKATSRLDKENEYRNSRNSLMLSLNQIKNKLINQSAKQEVLYSLREALDAESRSYLQRFDKEADL